MKQKTKQLIDLEKLNFFLQIQFLFLIIVLTRLVLRGGVGSVGNASGSGDADVGLSNDSGSGANGAAGGGASGNDGFGSDNGGDGSVNGDSGREGN